MTLYTESEQRYGSPKITIELNKIIDKSGSIKRVQHLMNSLGIKSIVTKKYKH
jgi:hypothetical protein